MHSCWEGRVEALGETFGESKLLGQRWEFSWAQNFEETMKPVTEIGPLAISFELLELGGDFSSQILYIKCNIPCSFVFRSIIINLMTVSIYKKN